MQRVVWLPSILDYIAHSVVTFLEHFQLKYVLIIVGRKKEGLIISIFDIQDIHKNTVRVDFMLDIFPKLSHVNMILSTLFILLTVIQFSNATKDNPPKEEVLYESCTRKEDPSSILKHPKCLV